MPGRTVYAGLQLLDRQLVDRDGILSGKIDDLELERVPETGVLYVSAILSGPGVLAQRMGQRRWGAWLQRFHTQFSAHEGDPARIPFQVVSDFDGSVRLGAAHDDLAAASFDRWFREHFTSHIPGSGHEAQ